jgi:hypothetical protein
MIIGRRRGRGDRQRQIRRRDVGPATKRDQQENDIPRHEPEGPEANELDPPQAPA